MDVPLCTLDLSFRKFSTELSLTKSSDGKDVIVEESRLPSCSGIDADSVQSNCVSCKRQVDDLKNDLI